jgi:uncharacterized DUF497 family protein
MDHGGAVVRFEFDRAKSLSNKLKHGIEFVEAQRLWHDPDLVFGTARETDEERLLVIGMMDGKHWSATVTHRHSRFRLISVRRSRQKEIELYEGR